MGNIPVTALPPRNIRINIGYLTRTCILLGEVHVLAAGEYYATLRVNAEDLTKLTKHGISWAFD